MSRKDSPKMIERSIEQAKRAANAAKEIERQERYARYKKMAKFFVGAGIAGEDIESLITLLMHGDGIDIFEGAQDFRDQSRITYKLSEILTLVFLVVCMEGSCEFAHIADYIEFHKKTFEAMGLIHDGQVPSHDTFRTVFSNMDPVSLRESTIGSLYKILLKYLPTEDSGRLLILDGKEICGTGRAKNTRNPARNTNVFNVFDASHGINLIADPISSKTNEVPVAEDVLFALDIKGDMITADAMQAKERICSLIDWKKGFYTFPVKDKRTHAWQQIHGIFEDPRLSKGRKKYTVGNRVFEVYKLTRSRRIDDFPTTKLLVKMTSYIRKSEEPTVMYFMSNSKDVDRVIDAVCNRWQIENTLHKLKDSSLINEDGIRFRDDTALRNMTVITDLIAVLVYLVQALDPEMKLKFAKMAVKSDPIGSLLRVLEALGDEEFIRRFREGRKKPAIKRRINPAEKEDS